jgi:hypothetical protein
MGDNKMAGLTAAQITELANNTLANMNKDKVEEVAGDYTEYVALANLMNKNRVKYDSGDAIEWSLLQNGDENARHVGLHSRDNTNITDGTFSLSIPWKHTETSCAFDVRSRAMNSGDANRILDYVKLKTYEREISLVELMEDTFWQGPSSSTDTDTPFGLFGYWLSYNATAGFNGGNGNYGDIGGKSCANYSKLKHYTFNYSAVSENDLIDKTIDAVKYSGFKPMVKNAPIPGYANGQKRMMYTTWDTVKGLGKLLRSQNDDIGSQLDKYNGDARIGKIPVVDVPWITENKATSDPIVGIDWSQFHATFLRGRWRVETPFEKKDGQHNSRVSFIDYTYNFQCINRRKGLFLGAKSDPLSS